MWLLIDNENANPENGLSHLFQDFSTLHQHTSLTDLGLPNPLDAFYHCIVSLFPSLRHKHIVEDLETFCERTLM